MIKKINIRKIFRSAKVTIPSIIKYKRLVFKRLYKKHEDEEQIQEQKTHEHIHDEI